MSDAHRERDRRRTYIGEWRKYRGLTQEQLAERVGWSGVNISQLERGLQGYSQDGLEALAEALECDPGQLLMVDPATGDAIWSIWDRAKPSERKMIVSAATAILSAPLPDKD